MVLTNDVKDRTGARMNSGSRPAGALPSCMAGFA